MPLQKKKQCVNRVGPRRAPRIFLLLLLAGYSALLGGCRIVSSPSVPPVTPSPPASPAPPPTDAPTPTTASTDSPTVTAPPLPTTTVELVVAPIGSADELGWLSPLTYEPNLLPDEWMILSQLPAAPAYFLDLRLGADLTTVKGTQHVRVTNSEDVALDALYFRLYPNLLGGRMEVREVLVEDPADGRMQPVSGEYSAQDSVLRVPMMETLEPGEATTVLFTFVVDVPTTAGANYGILVYDEDILALAHFYPQLAVYDDEGWNLEVPPTYGDVVYAESSFFTVRVAAPEGLTLAASGALIDEESEAGTVTRTYVAGPVRDFYLAGSSGFAREETTVDGVRVIAYAPPSVAASNRRVVESAAAALEIFSELYGPYPYTELEIVATPTTALGVEYPGVIVMTTRLYDDVGGQDPVRESTVAHEVAHQWFYGLVGNDQLDEPWLDESFTQYATLRYFEERYGAAGATGFRNSLTGRWAAVNNADIPLGRPVEDYSGTEYGAIIYGRGALFFPALQEEIGSDAFERFLDMYVTRHRYGVATTDSLRATAEAACECDLSTLFATWVDP